MRKDYEERIKELRSKMTLNEKVGQLQQCGPSLVGAFDVSFDELLNMMFDGRITKEEFDKLKTQTADLDQDELANARLALRPQMEREAQDRIRRAEDGRKISFWNFQSSISDADKLLGEDGMAERCKERKRLRRIEKRQKPKREARMRQQER